MSRHWRVDFSLSGLGYRPFPVTAEERPQYRVEVRTGAGETSHDWVPGVRETLYAVLDGRPRVRCGLTAHDLSVRNETDTATDVTVRVRTDDESLFERTFGLAGGASETIPAAVDPTGVLRFRIETDDGRSKTVDWGHCTSNGALVVSVRDQGILVAVQPQLGS